MKWKPTNTSPDQDRIAYFLERERLLKREKRLALIGTIIWIVTTVLLMIWVIALAIDNLPVN